MNLNKKLKPILVVCLLFMMPLFCNADELPQNTSNQFCSYREYYTVVTPSSVVTFTFKAVGSVRWICVDGKLILEAGHNEGNENYFDFVSDFVREGGKMVKRQGRPIVLRMVVNEHSTPRELYNSFWLLDFRNKEPLLVGPMVSPELGRVFSVIWHEDNVMVVFDDEGGPEGGRFDDRPQWGKAERQFVKGVEAESTDKVFLKDRDTHELISMANLPLMNKDGVFHPGKRSYVNMPHDRLVRNGKLIPATVKKGEEKVKNARNIYPAYYYDYKTNKLTAVAIEDD